MDFSSVLDRCKKIDNTSSINFKCPIDLKKDFIRISKKNKVSVTSLLVALMSEFVDYDNLLSDNLSKHLILKVENE